MPIVQSHPLACLINSGTAGYPDHIRRRLKILNVMAMLIGPFVNSIPKETLAFTLGATRKAVQGKDKN